MSTQEPGAAELDILRSHLKARGMRYTPEREAVFKEIFARRDHFTVEELYLNLKRKKQVSLASIYRTIPILIEAGLVSEVFLEDGQARYELIFGREHHCHMRCTSCGKVVEFAAPEINQIVDLAGKEQGFSISGHRLEVMGLCRACREKES